MPKEVNLYGHALKNRANKIESKLKWVPFSLPFICPLTVALCSAIGGAIKDPSIVSGLQHISNFIEQFIVLAGGK